MEGSIVALIFAIIMIVTHIIKSIRENAEAVKRQPPDTEDELVIMRPKKPVKQPLKPNRPEEPSRGLRSPFDEPKIEPSRRKALVKKLSPQGEGHRFAVDPGTLDTTNIVAPTIDPTVKPELDSITGIYEQQDAAVRAASRSMPTIELSLLDSLKRPEGICQAVILAEIFNRPAWQEMSR